MCKKKRGEQGTLIRERIKKTGEVLLGLLYPRTCPVCTQVVSKKEGYICKSCEKRLIKIKNPRCKKCGKPLEDYRKEYCKDCERGNHVYQEGRAVWVYNKELRESIYRFKYSNKREYADYYVSSMVKGYTPWIASLHLDGIIPVPLHKSKQRARGFNQAQVLAEKLGAALQIPVYAEFLVRQKNTVPQKELNDKERQKNLKNAFKIVQNDVQLKRILLVDDIYTTGATIDACARILKEHGVRKVYFICLGTSGVN